MSGLRDKRNLVSSVKLSVPYFVVLVVAFIPLFVNLGAYPVQLWDESRIAINTYEMMRSGNYLITTFEGASETWNMKPPFLNWCQILSFKTFGVNEFAFRFPSALAGLILFLWIVKMFRNIGFSFLAGFVSVMLLIVSPGFLGFHAVRSGDYEGLLFLFLILQFGHFYLYLREPDTKKAFRHLYLMLVFLVLAVLTKSANGLFFLPAFGIWWVIEKKWKDHSVLKVISRGLLGIIAILSFYFLREIYDPGYIKNVWVNELGGRLSGSIDQDGFPNRFYWELYVRQTGGWIYATGFLFITAMFLGKKNERRFLLFSFTCAFIYYSIIHVSKTNTIWYNLAIIPVFAMISGISAEIIFTRILLTVNFTKSKIKAFSWFLIAPLLIPYGKTLQNSIEQTREVDKHEQFYAVTNFLRDQITAPPVKHWRFYSTEYCAHNWWYLKRLQDRGHDIRYTYNIDSLSVMDTIVCYEQKAIEYLDTAFVLDTLYFGDYQIVVPISEKASR